MSSAVSTRARLRLSDLPVGTPARICALEGDAGFQARLRELGFCEATRIERLAGRNTLLCRIGGTRLALSGRAADKIMVEFLPVGG